jgi:integrase
VARLTWSDEGVKLLLAKSKTDKEGEGAEVMIVFGGHEATCPVRALRRWLEAGGIQSGPVFRKINKAGRVEGRRLSDAARQILLRRAAQVGVKGPLAEPVSPHALRGGFVTVAFRNGVPDEEIMGHTPPSVTTRRNYVQRRSSVD